MLREEIFRSWNACKLKISDLKSRDKDKWALVKPKSAPEQIRVLSAHELKELKNELVEKELLLIKITQKVSNRKKKRITTFRLPPRAPPIS